MRSVGDGKETTVRETDRIFEAVASDGDARELLRTICFDRLSAERANRVAFAVTKSVAFYGFWSALRTKLLAETAFTHVFDVRLRFAGCYLDDRRDRLRT